LSSESEFKSSTLMTIGNRNNGWSRVYSNERHLFTRLLAIPGHLFTSLLAIPRRFFTRFLGRSIHLSRYSRNYLNSSSGYIPEHPMSCPRAPHVLSQSTPCLLSEHPMSCRIPASPRVSQRTTYFLSCLLTFAPCFLSFLLSCHLPEYPMPSRIPASSRDPQTPGNNSLGPPIEVLPVKSRGRHVYKLSLGCPTTFWGFDPPDVSMLNQNITNSVNLKFYVCILSSSGIWWLPNDQRSPKKVFP